MDGRRVALLCSALLLTTSCVDPGGGAGPPAAAEDPDEVIHALVRFPDGVSRSELSEEGSNLLWQVPADQITDDADGDGWWLVFLPPSYLDELVEREGLEWRRLPDGFRVERRRPDEPGSLLFVADGDACKTTPAPDTFCPYDTTTSAIPGVVCNRSILAELDAAPADFPPVLIGGNLTAYVETVNLGTTSGTDGVTAFRRPIKGVRVGKQRGKSPVPQLVVYGAQHSREWATAETILRTYRDFASRFRSGDPAIRALLADRAILFIPVMNPDGYARNHTGTTYNERNWRGNMQNCGVTPISGHDPNRNFAATWGQPGSTNTCSFNADTTYRGLSAGSGSETAALNAATAPGSHRTVLGLNTHTYGNLMLFTEGLSDGFGPCTTDSNCSAPDLGLFYRLAGTERAPRMIDEEDSSVPYLVGQTWRSLYRVSGDSVSEAVYRAPSTRFMSLAAEITYTSCGFNAERLPHGQLDQLAKNYRNFIESLAGQLDELASGTNPDFDLPHLHRRLPSGGPADLAEYPTLRVAAKTGIGSVNITPVDGAAGSTELDEVRPGVYYRQWRYRPEKPYEFSSTYTVCSKRGNCETTTVEEGEPFNLCDPTRWDIGAGFGFTPDDGPTGPREECFFDLSGSGSLPFQLTSKRRNLQHMEDARFIFSYRWKNTARARVLLSDNGFAGCSTASGTGCRIIESFDTSLGTRYDQRGDGNYRTAILDVDDFSRNDKVEVRFEVTSGGTDKSDFQVFDPVFVGWYVD